MSVEQVSMDIVIAVFPGDLPNLTWQAESIRIASSDHAIDHIFILLIMHRRDHLKYSALERIVSELILPCFCSLSSKVTIIRYSELFSDLKGHSNSATAKQAATAAFAASYVGKGDLLVLEDGEILDLSKKLQNRGDRCHFATNRLLSDSDEYRSKRLRQACELLGMGYNPAADGPGYSGKSYFLEKSALYQINEKLIGGFRWMSRGILNGNIICSLGDISRIWAGNTSGWDTQVKTCAVSAAEIANLHFEDRRTEVTALMKKVLIEVHRIEEFDPDLACRVIRRLSDLKKQQITFVQVGANDGDYLDPISPFVDPASWSGLVIEPVPHYFQCLLQRYVHFSNIVPLQYAVGRSPARRPIYYVDNDLLQGGEGTAPAWFKGVASFSLEHVLNHGITRNSILEVQVDVLPGRAIVQRYLDRAIDLLVVDVEGAEREVLESFGLQEKPPLCIIFECEHISGTDEIAITKLLETCGYSICWKRPDAVALRMTAELEERFGIPQNW